MLVQDNLDVIDRLIDDAEAQYRNFQHPDPYIGKLSLAVLAFLFSGCFTSNYVERALALLFG